MKTFLCRLLCAGLLLLILCMGLVSCVDGEDPNGEGTTAETTGTAENTSGTTEAAQSGPIELPEDFFD